MRSIESGSLRSRHGFEEGRNDDGKHTDAVPKGEQGFALVLAILALMLLTFLGLTLATTTSTELQIATNYRWGQQALYNAEAGLEAGKVILARTADPSHRLEGSTPHGDGPSRAPGSTTGTTQRPSRGSGRDFEKTELRHPRQHGIRAGPA